MKDSILWRLKYRPITLEDIPGREEMVQDLKRIASTNDIPHLLFTGPRGYGKMEMARLFAQYVLKEGFSSNCKIVYCSDPLTQEERSDTKKASYISTKRIGSTAGKRFTWPAFIFSRIKPFVEIKPIAFHPLKLLIIEDFHLLEDQQQGFRRLMEKYSTYCRMILLTDQISSIIDPIISRCNIVFFKQIPFSAFEKKIQYISQNENLKLRGNIPKTLYIVTRGNLPDSISYLQNASLYGTEITPDTIFRITKDEITENVGSLLRYAITLKTNRLKTPLSKIKKSGRNFSEVLEIICQEVYNLPVIEMVKADILRSVSQIDFQSVEAETEDIMFDYLVHNLIEIGVKFS
jgi:replication factor C small subunit